MATIHMSIYSMLMTVVFYTIATLCAFRAAAWLFAHALLPTLSRIVSYSYFYSHVDETVHHIKSSAPLTPSSAGAASQPGDADAGKLFKLVRTAAGHDLFVPVSITGPYHATAVVDSTVSAGTTVLALIRGIAMPCLFTTSVVSILVTCYPHLKAMINCARRNSISGSRQGLTTSPELNSNEPRTPSGPTETQDLNSTTGATNLSLVKDASPDDSNEAPGFKTRTKLNPAAPVFTPSPAYRLDPTVRAFVPRASGMNSSSVPASPADSAGPATPSPVRSAFTFALAARAAHGKGPGEGSSLPVGVGKMRMMQPEDMVDGERRAGEVFVFI